MSNIDQILAEPLDATSSPEGEFGVTAGIIARKLAARTSSSPGPPTAAARSATRRATATVSVSLT
ncbi:hypothetical protein [Tsukamurella pseudospumae]|uniref:Uncharacterized protein n=1 Tax=Tsukamurella pseudospumae TaxID=239498 RepID=A0A138AEA2_9ACTN|nr:hypothetical protein [Tsukamurella pseudospumae]KXP08697.1 hypothetical protein AXK60_08465 [Tsukamurella pseudospumae]